MRLRENAQAIGADRRKSPPREGPALLQGMVVSGVCGSQMTVRYHTRQGRILPDYVCQREAIEQAIALCQRVVGEHVDHAVGQLLVESVTPLALDVTLAVQPIWRNAAISMSIPRTASWQTRSRRTGTKSSAP